VKRESGGAARAGTAVQPKGAHRARQILAAARAVLIEEGYASLTTRKIAERVGIRQSNVQYYFPSKVELVRALFEHSVEEDLRVAREISQTELSPLTRMIRSVDQFLAQHHRRESQAFFRELWALSAHDDEVARVMNDFYGRWIDMATRNILAISPKLGRRKAERRALLVISLIDGLSLFRGPAGLEHPAVEGIEREVHAAVRALATAVELG
jgi:AcrR family transcriptional regulator